jgi:hypothetical protein
MEVSGQVQNQGALYQGKSLWYPLNTKLIGPQGWSGSGGKEEKNVLVRSIEFRFLDCPTGSLDTID